MNETQARTLREAHDAYVKSIYRKSRNQLVLMYRQEQAARGMYSLFGGPASKDELIFALVELRYPLASMNESVHVLYHVDGITNDVCEHCNACHQVRCADAMRILKLDYLGDLRNLTSSEADELIEELRRALAAKRVASD